MLSSKDSLNIGASYLGKANFNNGFSSFSRLGTLSGKTLAMYIKSLFANNEVGFAYDPNDLSTLYQDAAGTIPVTGAGQPVGLMFDKSKGLTLGVELLPPVANKSLWSVVGSPTYGNVTVDGTSVIFSSNKDGVLVYTTGQFSSSKMYKFSITVAEITGALYLENAEAGGSIRINSPGTYTCVARNVSKFYLRNGGLGAVVTAIITAASAKEIVGNHAYQTNAASRPLLQRNATTGAYYLAFDGTDDFLVTSSIDFTATDKVSLFAGVRKLSDANRGMIAELSASVGSYNGTFSIEGNDGGARKYFQQSKGSLLSVAGTSDVIFSAPNNAVLTSKLNINTDTNELIVNGLYRYTSTQDQGTGNYGNYPLYIGRRGGTSLPFNGHLYSLIGIGRLTTDSETIALEKSIAKNVGVTL